MVLLLLQLLKLNGKRSLVSFLHRSAVDWVKPRFCHIHRNFTGKVVIFHFLLVLLSRCCEVLIFLKNLQRRNVISTWSSGTGAAGVGGALTYAGLISIGFTPKSSLLLMLLVPLIQAFAFFVLLEEQNGGGSNTSAASSTTSLIDHTNIDEEIGFNQPPLDLNQKLQYAPKLMKYVLPLFTVYICEYFINQGLVSIG